MEFNKDNHEVVTTYSDRHLDMNADLRKTRGFALARFEKEMSLFQRRMFATALSQVRPGDSVLSAYNVNVLEIAKALKIAKTSIVPNGNNAAATLLDKNIKVYWETDNGWVRANLFDNVERVDEYNYRIQFGSKIMPYLIAMREQYDMAYPLGGPLSFKSKYSHLVYDYFLTVMLESGLECGSVLELHLTPDMLRQAAQTKEGEYVRDMHLKQRVFDMVVPDIHNFTEINVGKVETVYKKGPSGRGRVTDYWLTPLSFKEGLEFPFKQTKPTLQVSLFDDNSFLPTDEELDMMMNDLRVSASFRKHVLRRGQPLRALKSILYTKLHAGDPAYFNKCYKEDWARDCDINEMRMQLADREAAAKQIAATDYTDVINHFRENEQKLEERKRNKD